METGLWEGEREYGKYSNDANNVTSFLEPGSPREFRCTQRRLQIEEGKCDSYGHASPALLLPISYRIEKGGGVEARRTTKLGGVVDSDEQYRNGAGVLVYNDWPV